MQIQLLQARVVYHVDRCQLVVKKIEVGQLQVIGHINRGEVVTIATEPGQCDEVLDTFHVGNILVVHFQLGARVELGRRDDACGILAHQVGAEVRVRKVRGVDGHVGAGGKRCRQHGQE